MKKILLATVGLLALGIAAPASAADLPARTYSKAPPPMMAVIYDWSGFYMGLNGGWGSSHKCWTNTRHGVPRRSAKAAAMRPAASPVARSVIAGSRADWCSAWKARATGPI